MATKKFLDQTGTSHLWNAIKTQLDAKATQEALNALATQVAGLESAGTATSTTLSTLVGSDTNKSVRTIANEELAAQLIPASASESLDTLQEIAGWIQDHPSDASAMNASITNLANILAGIGDTTNGEKATVKAYVDDAITALSIGDYVTATSLATTLGDYVTATSLATTLTGYMATSHPANSITSQNLTNYADAVAKKHEHSNKAVLDGITSEKVTAWDTAAADSYVALTNSEIDKIIAGTNAN